MADYSTSLRCRRAKHSSSADSATGPFGVSCRKFRVGAPPVRPLPLRSEYVWGDSDTTRKIKTAALRILHDHGVPESSEAPGDPELWTGWIREEYEQVYIVSMSIPDVPETSRPTVIIEGEWQGPSSAATWVQVVKEVKQFVNKSYSEGQIPFDFDVEMLATDLIWPLYTDGIRQLESQWPVTARHILEILENSDASRGCVRLISLEKAGYSQSERDIKPVTVYVVVSYEFDEGQWQPIIEAIEAYLGSLPHVPILRLEHNKWHLGLWDSPVISKQGFATPKINAALYGDYRDLVDLGCDIGANQNPFNRTDDRSHQTMGTLGCFIEVKARGGQWKKLALTSYNVVRPALQGVVTETDDSDVAAPPSSSLLLESDCQGVLPEKAPVVFDHPSQRKHDVVMETLERVLDRRPNAKDIRELYEAKKEFFDQGKQILGTLWAASGLKRRSKGNHRLNWALLDVVPHRQGTNTLPRAEEWRRYENGDCERPSKPLRVPQTTNYRNATLKSMIPDDHSVHKVGAMSGPTEGFVHGYKAITKFAEDANLGLPPSVEFEVCIEDRRKPFSKPGDSGSAVYSHSGHLVGLLFATLETQQAENRTRTLVTPIQDIFEDIIKFTGFDEIRVAQP